MCVFVRVYMCNSKQGKREIIKRFLLEHSPRNAYRRKTYPSSNVERGILLSHSANNTWKAMNTTISSPAMDK